MQFLASVMQLLLKKKLTTLNVDSVKDFSSHL